MKQKPANAKKTIIQAVKKRIQQQLPKTQGALAVEFFKQLYSAIAVDDLERHSIEDLTSSFLCLWKSYVKRQPGKCKIRIYNPNKKEHGWESKHTLVEVIHDDMPFLVNSIRMEIDRFNLTTHVIIHTGNVWVKRNTQHTIQKILPRGAAVSADLNAEAIIYLEIDRQTNQKLLSELKSNLKRVLGDVRAAVSDWFKMRCCIQEAIANLNRLRQLFSRVEFAESIAFLRWIENHHFTFLGIRDYKLVQERGEQALRMIPGSGLGVLRDTSRSVVSRRLKAMTPEARKLTLSSQILIISKTNTHSTVHRATYTDYIGVKRFDEKGNVIGERRIIGLYTSAAYNASPKHIPFLRRKVASVMRQSKVPPKSHVGKVLLNILETLPRDDLFQATPAELLNITMGVFYLQERRRIRMFARKDVYGRFISCLVYVPRDIFNTELRLEMQRILSEGFQAQEVTFSPRFFDSVLARIHFIVRVDPHNPVKYDLNEIEKQLIQAGRSWSDDLEDQLLENFGVERRNELATRYEKAFSTSYQEHFKANIAVDDIEHIEELSENKTLTLNVYKNEENGSLRFKVYQFENIIYLSDVIPILENMGLRILSQRPYWITLEKEKRICISDLSIEYVRGEQLNLDKLKLPFQEAFAQIWFEEVENDGFNELILSAALNWREVTILRAYAKYLRQTAFIFSQDYIEKTFKTYPEIVARIVELFLLRFDPKKTKNREERMSILIKRLQIAMDNVASLDDDRILRRYLALISATLRTNYFQSNDAGEAKSYLSLKLDPTQIPDLPLPLPKYEIFVYSPHFEAVHLRGGKVARGGLRWSNRREDFRTEVLGLMKAQQVKNSVIVPTGAKGGFVPKRLFECTDRESIMIEGISCYQQFIHGMLDITDNLIADKVIKPVRTVCYDEADPYLVVAPDKGTATFSDIANEVAKSYKFWLGDAFASGGSTGYDHKQMGITARGAWESVKRHFRQLGRNIQQSAFTVIGIGDMSGDVFGNGMLLSPHTKLVGAFNHQHIFLDPDPDPKKSFAERKRLFALPRSGWEDYKHKLISKGGGVFKRSAKSIKLTVEVKELLQLEQDHIIPNELVQAMLCARVDLLWSAGIGTFVKSSLEDHEDAGDRSNDHIRVNANTLRCRVIGEGGNLGLTQLARIEYALKGGKIYTDFIDNSAGVDCSDHEVNTKILLNNLVRSKKMSVEERNDLLVKMTDEVASLVLYNNYQQAQAISFATAQAARNIGLHIRYIQDLETNGKLQRDLEFIPDDKVLLEYKHMGQGLSSPIIAVLLSYGKMTLKEEILSSEIAEDKYLSKTAYFAFPALIREQYHKKILRHRLHREIIATQLSNILVNEMGFTFVYRMQDETGASSAEVVRCYMIARAIFSLDKIREAIESLDNKTSPATQIAMMMQMTRLLRRMTRWLLRNRRTAISAENVIDYFAPGVKVLKEKLPEFLGASELAYYRERIQEYMEFKVTRQVAAEMASARFLFSALDIIEMATKLKIKVEQVATVYYAIGERLQLSWIRSQVIDQPVENRWEALTRESLRDDLSSQQRLLTVTLLKGKKRIQNIVRYLDDWQKKHHGLVTHWQHMLDELRAVGHVNFSMYFTVIKGLFDLAQASKQNNNGH